MNRKTWYWIAGIAAAAVVAAIVWALAGRTPAQAPAAATPAATGHGDMDHGDMDHGPSDRPEDPELQGYLEEQDAIMADMMTGMMSIQRSGSADIDFLAGMIPHHQSAVAMAQSYLDHGAAHDVLAPLARTIIDTQTDEIGQMEGMIDELKAAGTADAQRADAYWEAYAGLMDHSMSHATADSLDAAFADGMIAHHQMAVDMAQAVLPHAEDEGVKALAQAIIDAQEQEIADMQAVLDGQGA